MQIGYALPDVTIRHQRTDVAETSDEALIEAIAGGDKQALKVLFTRHNVQVHRFALRLTGNSSTAEDIVNDVFFDVWRHAAAFEAKSRVSTWLLAIARYKAISVIRAPLGGAMGRGVYIDHRGFGGQSGRFDGQERAAALSSGNV